MSAAVAPLVRAVRFLERLAGGRRCRVCGCTDHAACPDGCAWVEPDLCSSCRGTA